MCDGGATTAGPSFRSSMFRCRGGVTAELRPSLEYFEAICAICAICAVGVIYVRGAVHVRAIRASPHRDVSWVEVFQIFRAKESRSLGRPWGAEYEDAEQER